MRTVYKVLDPQTGVYTDANTLEECASVIADKALSLYLAQTYDAPYSVCVINDEGVETWMRPDGTHTLSVTERLKKVREGVGNMLTSIPATPVETLP